MPDRQELRWEIYSAWLWAAEPDGAGRMAFALTWLASGCTEGGLEVLEFSASDWQREAANQWKRGEYKQLAAAIEKHAPDLPPVFADYVRSGGNADVFLQKDGKRVRQAVLWDDLYMLCLLILVFFGVGDWLFRRRWPRKAGPFRIAARWRDDTVFGCVGLWEFWTAAWGLLIYYGFYLWWPMKWTDWWMILSSLGFVGVLLAVAALFQRWRVIKNHFGLRLGVFFEPGTARWLCFGVIGQLVLSHLLHYFSTHYLALDLSDSLDLESLDEPVGALWKDFLIACVFAPIGEELIFRGVIFAWLRTRLGLGAGMILSSLIFASVHFYSAAGFVDVFIFGCFFALIYEKTRSILPGIAFHAVVNYWLTGATWLLFGGG